MSLAIFLATSFQNAILPFCNKGFRLRGIKLAEITEEQFPLEKDIQRLTEANLQQIFEIDLVRSEFEIHGLRIDTLAFDVESGAFVIIEYKKDRNFSVIDQGVAYLNLMLNNKADFILEYNERSSSLSSKTLKRDVVDWSQSRIIFISPEFTKYQQYAIGFKDLGIQLWEVHKYSNGLIGFDEIKAIDRQESISTITKRNPIAKKVAEEIRVYTEEDHLNEVDDNIKEVYLELKSTVSTLGNDIEIRTKKKYVAFRRTHAFVYINFLKSKLKIHLNVEINESDDPLKKVRDVQDMRPYSSGKTEIIIKDTSEIPSVLPLIKQAYEKS